MEDQIDFVIAMNNVAASAREAITEAQKPFGTAGYAAYMRAGFDGTEDAVEMIIAAKFDSCQIELDRLRAALRGARDMAVGWMLTEARLTPERALANVRVFDAILNQS